MKKLILVATAVFMVCIAKAQLSSGNFAYGVKGGWNVTNVSNAEAKNKMSIHLGAFAEYNLNYCIPVRDSGINMIGTEKR